MVKVNGTPLPLDGTSLAAYLTEAHYDKSRIAVEKNGLIVPQAQYEETVLCDGDVVEVVSFVGGG